MVPMTFIWWIYHFWARFWPYFNFVDFRAYYGPFSLVNRDWQKMADLLRKMASNQKMPENKPTLKFNFTIEKRWPVSIFELFGPQHLSHWALMSRGLTSASHVLKGCELDGGPSNLVNKKVECVLQSYQLICTSGHRLMAPGGAFLGHPVPLTHSSSKDIV